MRKIFLVIYLFMIFCSCKNYVIAQRHFIKHTLNTSSLCINNEINKEHSISSCYLNLSYNSFFYNEPYHNDKIYLSFSPKVGQANTLHYAFFGNSINYRYNNLIVSTDYAYLIDLDIFSRSHNSFHLLGISSGMRFIKNRLLFDLQIGTGINWHKRTGYQNTNSAIALNMKSALKYFPNNKFAIGVDALVSVNKLENLYALPLFSIEYGFMR